MATLPYGAVADDTGELFVGRVAVTPVLLESNGSLDTNRENWNRQHIDQALSNLQQGLHWWSDLLATKSSIHSLDFQIDTTYALNPVPTAYEPINRVSNDYQLWVPEFLNRVGFNQRESIDDNIRDFNDSQRTKLSADWSFTVFIVNSQVDQDGTFASGGSFSRAFAFAGGLYFVIPSTRPASTYAHETGHMFWARDEYSGGSTYLMRRGYYNTQNLNAIDLNPAGASFQQATSIMSAGNVLQNAYDQVVSPPATLAMLGWQDTDADGVFDAFDVPLILDGVGQLDATAGQYRFRGSAKTDTLPNLNSSGLQNDITLNKISRIEYRLNNGSWTTFLSPNAYEVDLNFSIPVGTTTGTIEIRAIDAKTGITSNLFKGTLGAKADSTTSSGITGFAWSDLDSDGIWDLDESARTGFTVRLVDANGQQLNLQKSIEPDDKGTGELPTGAYAGVSLTAFGLDTDGSVGVFVDSRAVSGTKVFRPFSVASQDFAFAWRGGNQQLRIDFQSLTNYVSVDVAGAESGSVARLEIYNSAGQLLDRATSSGLNNGQSTKLELGRTTADIAYAIVKGHLGTSILIDNLRYGPSASTKIDALGRYAFPNLLAGTYNVQIVTPAQGYTKTSPVSGTQSVSVTATQASSHVDFGIHFDGSPWNNDINPVDVNKDGSVTPLDALLIINQLNLSGSLSLDNSSITTPPFIDVSNDRLLTPLDALLVINHLNLNGIGGEGEIQVGSSRTNYSAGSSPPDGEQSIDPVWNRYSAEVGPLLANREFTERLELPRWTGSLPCNCPYCASIG